jgi:hypothetical protein
MSYEPLKVIIKYWQKVVIVTNTITVSMILSNFDFHMFKLYKDGFTFSKVFMMAYDVSLFSRFISVIISWADLF